MVNNLAKLSMVFPYVAPPRVDEWDSMPSAAHSTCVATHQSMLRRSEGLAAQMQQHQSAAVAAQVEVASTRETVRQLEEAMGHLRRSVDSLSAELESCREAEAVAKDRVQQLDGQLVAATEQLEDAQKDLQHVQVRSTFGVMQTVDLVHTVALESECAQRSLLKHRYRCAFINNHSCIDPIL